MVKTVDDNARAKALRAEISDLQAKLEGASLSEKKPLRWKIATLQEELADCNCRLRENRPKVQTGTTWAGTADFRWSELEHKKWLELEQMGDVEKTTRGEMISAFRDALACRGLLTDVQRYYLELSLSGGGVTAIAVAEGKAKSTISRTLKRARTHLECEANRLYKGRKLVDLKGKDGVLRLEDIDQQVLRELLQVERERR